MAKLGKIACGLPSGNDALTVRLGIENGIFETEGQCLTEIAARLRFQPLLATALA